MRLVLFVAVLALGADALLYNGAYTQAAWREASGHVERLLDKAPPPPAASAATAEVAHPPSEARHLSLEGL
jgi:hypothetical protein